MVANTNNISFDHRNVPKILKMTTELQVIGVCQDHYFLQSAGVHNHLHGDLFVVVEVHVHKNFFGADSLGLDDEAESFLYLDLAIW